MTSRAIVSEEIDALQLNRRHYLVFALCGAGLFFEALNLQVMSFVAPMVAHEWALTPTLTGVLISAAIAGMLVGTYTFGIIADRFGRRPAFQLTVGIFSLLTALSAAAATFGLLVLTRFGAGVGIGGSIPVETAVLAEFTPTRLRTRIIAIWAMALPLGAFCAPLCVALLPTSFGWRGLLAIGGIPAILVLFIRRMVPETPAYLAGAGKPAAAEHALAWIAMRPPQPVEETDSLVKDLGEPKARAAALFDPDMRRVTIMAWSLNFGSFFAYYGFVLWLPGLLSNVHALARPDIIRFMLLVAMAGMSGRIVTMLLAGRLEQRTIILTCGLGGAISLIGFGLQAAYLPLMACAVIAAFFLEGTFSASIPLVADLYPAKMRATGVGWAGGMGRLGTVVAPLAIGMLVNGNSLAAPFLLACGALIAAGATRFDADRARASNRRP